MHVAEANLCIMASSSSQSSTDVKDQNCFLLSLPVYLREKILVFAITIPDGIYPRQRDKFPGTFTYTYADRLDGRQYALEEPPTAVQLGLTCRQLHEEVTNANLLYKHNQFRFMDPAFAHTYLRTIPPLRMMSIESIYLELDYVYNPTQAINLISTCKGLKHLRLYFDYYDLRPEIVGWKSLLRIRGLESFAVLCIPNYCDWNEAGRAGSPKNMELMIEKEDRGRHRHITHVKRRAMRPRTERNYRKAERAVANDCYCPQSLLLHTEDEVVGCDCKDPEYLEAAKEDREYRGDGSCEYPFRRLVDLETDFLDGDLPQPRPGHTNQTKSLSTEMKERFHSALPE
jgi:hypothetical protein